MPGGVELRRRVWAVSSRQRNDFSIFLRGSPVTERHSRPPFERVFDDLKVVGRGQAEISSLVHVSPQEPVGVLVRAVLPRGVRIAEVDRDVGSEGECGVTCHLRSLVPR